MDWSKLTTSLTPLRAREFRLLFTAQTTSVVGDNFTTVALAFAVLDLTGSAADLGVVLAARTVPLVVLVLAGGVWADRLPRQRLMLGANLARFASQGLLAALLVTGHTRLWQLVALMAAHGTAGAFFYPASSGLIPQTVPAQELQRANALLSLAHSSAAIVGPALAGALVAATSPGWAIAIDALSFAGSALVLARMGPVGAVRVAAGGFVGELAAGWGEVRARTWLWASIVDFALFQVGALGVLFVLGPLVADRSLGGPSAWGVLLAALGVGSVLGDLVALRAAPRRLLVAMTLALLATAPTLVLLGLAAPLWAIAAAQVLYGAGMAFAVTLWFTALQQHVPPHALSRVSAYDWLGSTALRPLGLAAAGPIATAVGVGTTLLGAATLVVGSSLVLLSLPSVRSLQRREGTEATHVEASGAR